MLPEFKFHHIGVAVRDIEATAPLYEQGGYHRSSTVLDPMQDVYICWLTRAGFPAVELLMPANENAPVNKTLEKNGVTPYHTCYVVQNIEEAALKLRRQHYVMVGRPAVAVAFCGARVAFFYNKAVGLIELVEEPAAMID
ncbi:MAG: VOC family protein [Bacteroidales bacterium]|nr:VOC family protein [Bacteroidales bacterium]